ncbi:MAG: MFS transporter [Marmoricola sp.]|nr:MFS transporter [Marmoricola sp.]
MSRLLETALPARLGRPFRWLVLSTWVTCIGDGIALAAAPLLVASETKDPFLVALAAMLKYLPALLFGLFAGVVADRVDRKLMVAVSDGSRAFVVAVLIGSVLSGHVDIALVLVAVFLLGTGETFADTAYATLPPMLVAKRDLGPANARLQGGFLVGSQLAGPPLGALLFGLGRAWPFVAQLVCVVLGVLLILQMRLPSRAVAPASRGMRSVGHEIVEGLRWTWHHAAVRTLVVTILIFNVTFGAAWSVLVLYAHERLGMGAFGFGLLTTALATGGIVGMASYGWLERHLSLGMIMRGGLVIETLTHLVLAVTRQPWVAMAVMVVFGVHAFVWGTTSQAVRQRAVPDEVQGRVNAVNRIGTMGGIVVGSFIGGLIAGRWGVTAPFWFGFAGSAVFLVLMWRQLLHIAHADEAVTAS